MRLLSIFVLQWLFNLRFLLFHRGIYCLLCTSAALHLTFIALRPTELFLKPKKGICVRPGNLLENCLKHWNKSCKNHIELARKYFPVSLKCHFFNFDLYSLLCHSEVMLKTFSCCNEKSLKKEWDWPIAISSLWSRHLLCTLVECVPIEKPNQAVQGLEPNSSSHFISQKPALCSAFVYMLLFLTEIQSWTWEMVFT